MKNYDVIIVGSGPAGILAGIKAGERGKKVAILEKNKQICKKLLLTGQGRCNLTNLADLNTYLSKYKNGIFLRNAFYQFFNTDLLEFFNKNGLALKVERGKRVFPESDESGDVAATLKKLLKKNGVKLFLKTPVKNIEKNKKSFEIIAPKERLSSAKVILACGGKSYPDTGSSGDGYTFAEKFGHTITSLTPALCGFNIQESFIKKWQGITLKNVRVHIVCNKKKIAEEFGEMLFTHYGVSGPTIFNTSGNTGEYTGKGELKLIINFKPAIDEKKLDNRFQREFKENSNKQLKNIFKNLLPKNLIKEFLEYSNVNGEKEGNQVTKEERKTMVRNLQHFTLTISDLREFEDSMVTRGGVSVKEINPKTMESKLVPGLFFAGEIIDIDGQTGGYNLQAAFTTGYVAGTHI